MAQPDRPWPPPRDANRERFEAWERQVLRQPPAAVEPVSRELGEPTWGERAFDFEPREPSLWQRLRSWWTRPKRERHDCDWCGRPMDWPGSGPCSRCYFATAAMRLPRPVANPFYASTVKK